MNRREFLKRLLAFQDAPPLIAQEIMDLTMRQTDWIARIMQPTFNAANIYNLDFRK